MLVEFGIKIKKKLISFGNLPPAFTSVTHEQVFLDNFIDNVHMLMYMKKKFALMSFSLTSGEGGCGFVLRQHKDDLSLKVLPAI